MSPYTRLFETAIKASKRVISYRTGLVSREGWSVGEWDKEPDEVIWISEVTGLVCKIIRTPEIGNWCGYVMLEEGMIGYGVHYDGIENVSVHGGLTYSEWESLKLTTVEGGEETRKFWVVGFDCAHHMDYCPFQSKLGISMDKSAISQYKRASFVIDETESLAKQMTSDEVYTTLFPNNRPDDVIFDFDDFKDAIKDL